MTQTREELVQSFLDYVKETDHYEEALRLMGWDLQTGAPRKGVGLRSEAIGTLSDVVFRRQTGSEMESYLERLSEPSTFAELDPVTQATVRELKREMDRNKKIPPELMKSFVVLTSEAESVWAEAKDKADFAMFQPYLERIVETTKQFAEIWREDYPTPYDSLLDMYEPGLTVEVVDRLFAELRADTVKLVEEIVDSGIQPKVAALHQSFDIRQQEAVSRRLLAYIGYDFEGGRLDTTVHPFQSTINRFDARVTTMYKENDLTASMFSTIHEGGHALYEQGVSTDLIGTPLSSGTSMGMHESQSRFYENMIGRSKAFWEPLYPELQTSFPQLQGLPLEDFYAAINHVEPSLIRIDADEVTYNLHIMIRYEIEKGLINGDLKVADLPGIWREKMKEYLGIEPPNDAQGVLQDVHWSGGMFGYFPSYALGNLYAAQIRATLLKEIPDVFEQVRAGNLTVVRNWLQEKVHRHGKMLAPREILRQVTGEDLSGKYLVDYLREKYGPLYHLS